MSVIGDYVKWNMLVVYSKVLKDFVFIYILLKIGM